MCKKSPPRQAAKAGLFAAQDLQHDVKFTVSGGAVPSSPAANAEAAESSEAQALTLNTDGNFCCDITENRLNSVLTFSIEAAMKFALWLSAVCGLLLLVSRVEAQTLFYDGFDNSVGGNIIWSPWGNVSGDPTTPNGKYNLVTTDSSHALSGTQSRRAWEADPAVWDGYSDFGATDAGLKATVYLFEDMSYVPPYSDQPAWKQPYIEVRAMFSLFGDNPTNTLSDSTDNTDYLELRIYPDLDEPGNPLPDHFTYGIETKYNDGHGLGIIDTGVPREKSQWMKFTIEADSMADGGQVRFYINDVLVGTSYRTGADLRWVMIGSNKITYENYWYDDVSVVNLNGDYNGDGVTDAADYVLWRKKYDGGFIDGYNTWRENFGASGPVGGAAWEALERPCPNRPQ